MQEHYSRSQSTPRIDPSLHGCRICRIQHLCRIRIGDCSAIHAEVIGGVEAEPGAGGNADLVVRYRAEDESARRGAETVDYHGFAGRAQAVEFFEVVSDLAAPIIRYADCCMTCTHVRKQKGCGEQTRHELHFPPLVRVNRLDGLRDARSSDSLVRVRGLI